MPDTTSCESVHEGPEPELDESGNPIGPEWGSPVGLDEFAAVADPDEPEDEPGPSDCAR